jgi:hypothetical protein
MNTTTHVDRKVRQGLEVIRGDPSRAGELYRAMEDEAAEYARQHRSKNLERATDCVPLDPVDRLSLISSAISPVALRWTSTFAARWHFTPPTAETFRKSVAPTSLAAEVPDTKPGWNGSGPKPAWYIERGVEATDSTPTLRG